MLTVTQSGLLRLCEISTGSPIGQAIQHADPVLDVQWSPDGENVVTACADGKVWIWSAGTGELLNKGISHAGKVSCARFSPNGKYLATASSDRTARIWKVATGAAVTPAMVHDAAVLFVDFSPDGLKIVSVAADQTAHIWDARSGKPLTRPLKHKTTYSQEAIQSARFLENGLWMATGGVNPRLWDVRTGQPLTGEASLEPWSTYSGGQVVVSPKGPALAPIRHGTHFIPLLLAPLPIPDWLSSWADAASGFRINDRGEVEQLSFTELSRLRKQLRDSPEQSEYARWAKWYFSDRASRQINPYSQISVREFVARHNIKDIRAGGAHRLSPSDSSAWAKSARAHLSNLAERMSAFTAKERERNIQHTLVLALMDSERSLRMSPDESEAWQARAEFWRQLGHVEEAFEAANKADQLNPDNPELWSLRGSLLELSRRFDDALRHYSRAIVMAENQGAVGSAALTEALLRRSGLLRRLNRSGDSQADFLRAKNIPARDPQAQADLIDLTAYYNASLTESWLAPYYDTLEAGMRSPRPTPSDFLELPQGIVTLGDATFDVRGLIQVGAASPTGENYPMQVTDIAVRRACARLHFLHAAIFAADAPDGTQIGSYLIHYETGRNEESPIIIGQSLADCFTPPNEEKKSFTIAWTGRNAESRRRGSTIRLFKSTWQNPAPTESIHSIDFALKSPGPAAPFLVAIKAE